MMHPPEAFCSLVAYATYFVPAGFLLFAFLIPAKPSCGHTSHLVVFTGSTQDGSTLQLLGEVSLLFTRRFLSSLSEGHIRT